MKEKFVQYSLLLLPVLAGLGQLASAQTATPIFTNAPIITVYATDASASEIGPDTGTFTVHRTGGTNDSLTVFCRVSGTASNGVDYQSLSNTVTIAAGASSAEITVTPIPDLLPEVKETVVLTIIPSPLLNIAQYLVGFPKTAVVTITDDSVVQTNLPPVVNIIATDPEGSEIPVVPPGMGMPQRIDPAIFTVTRTGDTGFPMVVFYSIGGTASNGVDYAALPGTVTIPEGADSATIEVDPIDDFLVEGTETVVLTLEPPICPAIFPPPPDCYRVGLFNQAIAYIRDNDISNSNLPPVVNIFTPGDGAIFKGPADILIAASAHDVDDSVSTVEFFAGTNSLGIRTNLPVLNPLGPFALVWTNVPIGKYTLTALATDERGATALSSPVHIAVLETNRPPVTNPPPIVTIIATDPIAAEGTNFWFWPVPTSDGIWETNLSPMLVWGTNCSGVNTATFKVRRSGQTNSDLTVYYSISGTASNGVDYEELPGLVTIPVGARAARIIVVPLDDKLDERVETVILKLQLPPDPTAAVTPPPYLIGFPGRAAAIIVDNDAPRPPCRSLPGGLFHLCKPGTNGFCFRLEASTNLVNWLPVCTNIVTDGAIHFVDPDAPDLARRFYRTLPEPNPPTD